MNKLLQEIKDENMHFWGFAGINVMYFSIWCIIAWYLTLWMEEVANIDSIYAGIIFSIMAASSLVLQPFFGIISDKLVFKKHLILTISILGVFIGPYFQYLFLDLLSINTFFYNYFNRNLFRFYLTWWFCCCRTIYSTSCSS